MEEGICILPYNKSIRAWQPNKANLHRVEPDGGIQATNHPLTYRSVPYLFVYYYAGDDDVQRT
jgi:hypothetical protein